MTVAPRNGKTIVIAPFAGSPAYKAGMRPGDVILEVNDKRTDSLNTTEVADLLKGPRGTQVQVVIAREGAEKPITFNIIRDEIPRKSVEDAFWLKPGVMYIEIQSVQREHQPRSGRELQAPRRAERQGSGPRPPRQSRRTAERGRRGRRPLPAKGADDRFAPWPILAGEALRRAAWQPGV